MTVEFNNVTYRYHYDDFDVLSGATFTLGDGVNTVLCDIQSGKGTICKLILGNLAPTSGQVLVNGQDATKLVKNQMDALYLTAQPSFFENRSVRYNLEYPLRVRKTLKQSGERLTELIEEFGLTELLNKKVKTLSLQQKLLLSLARGLTVRRQLVLLDGFFDDTNAINGCEALSITNVLAKFPCTTVLLTTRAHQAIGHTVVLDGGTCVYQGDSATAQQTVSSLTWLANKI